MIEKRAVMKNNADEKKDSECKRKSSVPRKEQVVFRGSDLDSDALKVIRRLHRYGHEAYFVGGCVRDLLLGRKPKDFDVATSATPEEMKKLFRNCRIIGRRFKLAHVFFGNHIIETSTFRANPQGEDIQEFALVENEDHDGIDPGVLAADREPEGPNPLFLRRDNVFGNAEQDALRRDFTINGLFYHPGKSSVIDYVGGLKDIKRGVIETIGDPRVRFREDPVRILRAIKFSARLDMRLESSTHDAMLEYRKELVHCAPARVLEEIRRLLGEGTSRKAIELMDSSSVLEILLAEAASALRDSMKAGVLRSRLNAVDHAVTKRDFMPERSLLLGNLLIATLDPEWMSSRDVSEYLKENLDPVLSRLKVPRRDKDCIYQMFAAQKRLFPGRKSRRMRSLTRQGYFSQALQLFALGIDPASASWESDFAHIRRITGLKENEIWSNKRLNIREDNRPPPRRKNRLFHNPNKTQHRR